MLYVRLCACTAVQFGAFLVSSHMTCQECACLQVPAHVAGFPADLRSNRRRQIALCDFLTRSFGRAVSSAGAGAYLSATLTYSCNGMAWPQLQVADRQPLVTPMLADTCAVLVFPFTQSRMLPEVIVRLSDSLLGICRCAHGERGMARQQGRRDDGGRAGAARAGAHSLLRQQSGRPARSVSLGRLVLKGAPAFQDYLLACDMPCLRYNVHRLGSDRCVSCMQGDIEARLTVALPARGRTILGTWAAQILAKSLPRCAPTPRPAAFARHRPHNHITVCMSPNFCKHGVSHVRNIVWVRWLHMDAGMWKQVCCTAPRMGQRLQSMWTVWRTHIGCALSCPSLAWWPL